MGHKLETGIETVGAVSFTIGAALEMVQMNPEGIIMLSIGSGLFIIGAITEHIRAHRDRVAIEPLAKSD